MASPFPGMDPYLEDPAFWRDFHHRFLDDWCDALTNQLPDEYDARLDETINRVHPSDEEMDKNYPDIAGTRKPGAERSKSTSGGGTLLLAPVTILHEYLDEYRQGRIENRKRPDRRLVAVLELLSPTNKIGDGFEEYRLKDVPCCIKRFTSSNWNCSWPANVPDADLHIELAKVFAFTYERGRYARELAYRKKPVAPMEAKDAKWAMALAAKK